MPVISWSLAEGKRGWRATTAHDRGDAEQWPAVPREAHFGIIAVLFAGGLREMRR